jgi:hypothetical protein
MKILFFTLIAVVLFITAIVPPGVANSDKKITYQEFMRAISSISTSIADSPDASVLLTMRDFRLLSDNASDYREMTLQILAEDVSIGEKFIAIYAMQNLNLDDYLLFLNELLARTRDRKIDANLLEHALMPGFEWNTKLQTNWKSPAVRDLIESIKASRTLPPRCDLYLDDIISGRGAEHVKQMRLDGELP